MVDDEVTADSELSILMPAYNEQEAIQPTLEALRKTFPDAEIIVIDDGSTDDTAAQAELVAGVTVLQHDFNRGYGRALKSGMRKASGAYLAWFDADNEHRSEDLAAMVERLQSGELAAVLGQRDRSIGTARALGKFVIWLLALALNVDLKRDVNCGLRVFRADVIRRYMHLLPNGFSASMTSTIVMLERGYPIEFYPITVNPRIGSSKVTVRDGVRTFILVLRTILLFSPLRFFLPFGIGLGVLGSLYGTIVAVSVGRGFPILAALFVTVGMLVVMIGLVADQISQIRLNEIDNELLD